MVGFNDSVPLRALWAARSVWAMRAALGVVLIGIALRVARFVAQYSYSLYDDAYIFFRYARNLLEGCGLAYNCGEPAVEGFTSLLHLALLTGMGAMFGGDFEDASQVLGLLTMVGVLFTLATLGSTRTLREALGHWGLFASVSAAVLLSASSLYLLNAVIGLEGCTASLAVLLVLRALLERSYSWLRLWLLMAVLARPECALFVLAAPLFPEARRLRFWWPLLAAGAVLLLLRLWIFGDFLPNTYWAKSGGTAQHFALGFAYLRDVLVDFPMLGLAPLGFLAPPLRRVTGYLLIVISLWLAFLLHSGGDTFSYGRLVVPLVAPATVLGLAGLQSFLADLLTRRGMARWVPAAATLGLTALPSAWLLGENRFAPRHGFDNVLRWQAVGEYLRAAHPGARIATVPIGAIGYYSGAPLIDLVGLTQPEIAKSGNTVPPERLDKNWIGHERHNTPWVIAQKPELIVMSKWRDRPWTSLAETRAGFYSEWLLLREIKQHRLPYRMLSVMVAPGVHWLMFQREPDA